MISAAAIRIDDFAKQEISHAKPAVEAAVATVYSLSKSMIRLFRTAMERCSNLTFLVSEIRSLRSLRMQSPGIIIDVVH